MDINWHTVLKEIDYNFDSNGASSIISINDEKYGELTFSWDGTRTKIRVSFSDTCVNCICKNPTIVDCDCDWIAFQEKLDNSIIFTKKQVQKLIQPTLF